MSLSLAGLNTKTMLTISTRCHRSHLLPVAALLLFVTLSASNLYAEERPIKGKPVLPGQDCQTPPRNSWTPQEKWVWKQVCQGKIADFNKIEGYGGVLDPKQDKKWPESRILSPAFLETILLHEPYRGALTRQGVCIVGAWFREPFDLSKATLSHQLWLDASRFESDVDLRSLQALRLLSLEKSTFNGIVDLARAELMGCVNMIGATFTGKLNMDSIQVKGHLLMRGGAEFAEVDLSAAEIGRHIEMTGSTFNGKLNMYGMQVEGHLLMHGGANFAEVDLTIASIGGQVAMIASTFNGKLNMNGIQVKGHLLMHGGANFAEVDLSAAEIGRHIEMTGSTFNGKLNMSGMQVEDHLFMHGGANFAEVDLIAAEIGGQIDMTGSTLSGKLNMNSMEVEGHLLMHGGANFAEVDLGSASIGGGVAMIASTFNGKLNMNGMQVEGGLLMRDQAQFAEVDLTAREIGGQIDMTGSTFSGKLNMGSIQVGESIFLRMAEAKAPIDFVFGKIGRNLDLSGTKMTALDLTGTRVGGELRLGSAMHPPPDWQQGAKLILRNVEVGALQDLQEAWPDTVELDGFSYGHLGGLAVGEKGGMAARDISWLKGWLGRQKGYSPQPYEQLARVLRKTGDYDKANEILYAGQERRRNETAGVKWLGFTLLKWVIGYGYGYRIFLSLFWVGVLVIIGSIVLRINKEGRAKGLIWCFFYSFDMILPIIRLDERHYEIRLDGFPKYYYYLHILAGYLLATFVIAGISGLTK